MRLQRAAFIGNMERPQALVPYPVANHPLPAGYSGTPLPKKLGIKPGHRVLLLSAPGRFEDDTLGELPDGRDGRPGGARARPT